MTRRYYFFLDFLDHCNIQKLILENKKIKIKLKIKMASLDYVVGEPFKLSATLLRKTIVDMTLAIAEEKKLPEAEVEHEAYTRLADFYHKNTQEVLTALERIGTSVDEYLESDWFKGMNHLIEALDKKARTLRSKSQ
jgi:hypothetical protein